MEFPLFPVSLRAAVQTPPAPWGRAGSGEISLFTHHWQLLRGSTSNGSSTARGDSFCLFSTSSSSSSGRNKSMLGFSPVAELLNVTRAVDTDAVFAGLKYRIIHSADDDNQEACFLSFQVSFSLGI